MDTRASDPATLSAAPAPDDVSRRPPSYPADNASDDPAPREPEATPEAWITLLFALLVTVFTLAAAWNWFRA